MPDFVQPIAQKLNIKLQQVEAVLSLFEEGATIPFIARYRKDKTGALDEVQIQQIQDEAKFLKEFHERKTFIEKTITDQEKMTEALQAKINKATTVAELEDAITGADFRIIEKEIMADNPVSCFIAAKKG